MLDNSSKEFNVGEVIEVTITNFANFGVFTHCQNGYKGLIHVSNIANDFVRNVSDYFSVNEKIKAEVVSIDSQNKKLGLSTKQFDLKAKNKTFTNSYSNNKRYNKF